MYRLCGYPVTMEKLDVSLGQCEAIPLLLRVGSGTETTVKHRQGRVKILGGKNILF